MIPSRYQEAIFDNISNGTGGIRVNAVSGSGKTTTLVEAAPLLVGTSLMCAFNKHIERALSAKLSNGVFTKTIHSIGMGSLYRHIGKLTVIEDKYKSICKPVGAVFAKKARGSSGLDEDAITTPGKASNTIAKLTRMAMMTLTDPNDHKALMDMARMYSIIIPKCQSKDIFSLVPQVIDQGNVMTRDGQISFDDMVYYPATNNLSCKEHLWVLVDEAQDLSAAQLAIVMNSLKGRGRLIAVGDPLQSIYGFSGADPWSFDRIGQHTPNDLPLSICYRCSESIVDLASNLVPQIESRDGAPQGIVSEIDTNQFHKGVQPGDMVLCRTNAPLVDAVIELVTNGKRAYMRGQDIMSTFLGIVDTVTGRGNYSWPMFNYVLQEIKLDMTLSLSKDGEEGAARFIGDMYDAVGKCASKLGCNNEVQLKNKIRDIFKESPNSVLCSSIHKAKGLEADNVYIIKPHKIRLNWKDQLDWQRYQEQCCEYVAITRAKNNLYMVREEDQPPYSIGERVHLPAK